MSVARASSVDRGHDAGGVAGGGDSSRQPPARPSALRQPPRGSAVARGSAVERRGRAAAAPAASAPARSPRSTAPRQTTRSTESQQPEPSLEIPRTPVTPDPVEPQLQDQGPSAQVDVRGGQASDSGSTHQTVREAVASSSVPSSDGRVQAQAVRVAAPDPAVISIDSGSSGSVAVLEGVEHADSTRGDLPPVDHPVPALPPSGFATQRIASGESR